MSHDHRDSLWLLAAVLSVIHHLLPLELLSSHRTETVARNSHPWGSSTYLPSPVNQLPFYFLPVSLMTPGTSDTHSYRICLLCNWFIALNRMSSGFIYVTESPSLFRLKTIPLCIYCISLFHSCIDKLVRHPPRHTYTPPPRLQAHLSITGIFLE